MLRDLLIPRRRRELSGASPSRAAWRRLRRDPLALASGLMIIITAFVAILGYLITPDPSPMANRQFLELATLPPGSRVHFLRVQRNTQPEPVSWLHQMAFGKPERDRYIPYDSIDWQQDGVMLTPVGGSAFPVAYSLADIVFALHDSLPVTEAGPDSLLIMLADGSSTTIHRQDLLEKARKKQSAVTFWLGTDLFGRDVLSRLLIGTRVSLSVGFISVFISLLIGVLLGALAGYYRSWIDDAIVWLINVVWSIPTLLLVIAITFALGRGFWQVFIAVGLTMWVEVARVVRGQFLAIREKEYVEAGRALGYRNIRIIWRHILPNAFSPVIVISAANFASAILMEAGLSFLGIGVQPPMPSWGSMIRENYAYIILDKAYLAILPGLAIMLMVLTFMLLGNALRDALDVKTNTKT